MEFSRKRERAVLSGNSGCVKESAAPFTPDQFEPGGSGRVS